MSLCEKCLHYQKGKWLGEPGIFCKKDNRFFSIWEDSPETCPNFKEPIKVIKEVEWNGLTPTIHIKKAED